MIAYKILAYLYVQLKTGEDIDVAMTYREWYVQYVEGQNGVANSGESGILTSQRINKQGDIPVHTIGKIDILKYSVISDRINIDEVIITDERIAHIKKRHPNDFERYSGYMADIVENPQYILEANKPNTAFLLKKYMSEGEQIQLILRLAVEGDPAD